VQNLEVVITFRYAEDLPVLIVGYDSRKQSLRRALWGLSKINPAGCTPEGLTFEVIQNMIPDGGHEKDVFFVNFSDGEPAFSNNTFTYWGDSARKHTSHEVKKLRDRGINVLSYFIETYEGSAGWEHFKSMYTKWAQHIDTTNIFEVAKSLNKRFSERET